MIKSIQRWAMAHHAKAKTLTWRVVASTDTFILGWSIIAYAGDDVTGAEIAGLIAGFEVVTKMFLYWTHEKLWEKVPYAEKKTSTTYTEFRKVDRGSMAAVCTDGPATCIRPMGATK